MEAERKDLMEEFTEAMENIQMELTQAYEMLPEGIIKARAKSYWYAQIITSIQNETGYLGHSMCTMQDTLAELGEQDDDEL